MVVEFWIRCCFKVLVDLWIVDIIKIVDWNMYLNVIVFFVCF